MKLAVQCTDRGQHPSIPLGDLVLDDDSTIKSNAAMAYGEHADSRKGEAVSIDEHGRVHLRCPRCLRHIQWRPDRAAEVIAALWEHNHDSGTARIDISHVPS